MRKKQIAPYGSWKSPITADLVGSGTTGIGKISVDGGDIYWVETRPSDGGRNVIVRHNSNDRNNDVTLKPYDVCTRVHEYGGGEYIVVDGNVYFLNLSDQSLYHQMFGSLPELVISERNMRYADLVFDSVRNRIICVREDHNHSINEVTNTLASISVSHDNDDIKHSEIITEGEDFYSSPRISPDGSSLAWISWNHPNMPWDGTDVWIANIHNDGSIGKPEHIAGGLNESISQPEWSPEGILHFISDRSGWWNIYRRLQGETQSLKEMEVEFGVPQWVFGQSTYAFISSCEIACTYTKNGKWFLAIMNTKTEEIKTIGSPYSNLSNVKTKQGDLIFIAGSPTEPSTIFQLNSDDKKLKIIRRSHNISIDPGTISIPRIIEFPTGNGLKAHGFFYLPKNINYKLLNDDKPPLLVVSHGGPTGATSTEINLEIQYWTSRGISVLDVNYGGSSGYGRNYRNRINGKWGIVDVEDCVNGALHLVKLGEVNGDGLAIRGSSAGGYTTLCALTFRNIFKVGACYYGISDLGSLAKETHKFESHYLDTLIGPSEKKDLYSERSPINKTTDVYSPVIFFQGLEDEVVSPHQSESMFKKVAMSGIPTAYLTFKREKHGFKMAENIKQSLESELYFYSRILDFDLTDDIKPLSIENL